MLKKRNGFWIIILLASVVLTPLPADHADYTVLVIHSYSRDFLWTRQLDDGINQTFSTSDLDVHIITEYMDTKRFSPLDVEPYLLPLYIEKYQKMHIDLVITTDDNAFNFMLQYGDQIAGDVPLLFSGLNRFPDTRKLPGHISGIVEDVDISACIDFIIRLLPNLQTLYAVAGSSESSQATLQVLQYLKGRNTGWPDIEIITDVSMAELGEALRIIPEGNAVLNLAFWRDRTGHTFTHEEILPYIADISPVPVFTLWDHMVQGGTLGGVVLDGYLHGEEAASLGIQVLSGTPVSDIPVSAHKSVSSVLMYDVVKKFNLDEAMIPEGTDVVGKEPTFFQLHGKIIAVSTAIVAVLCALIIRLLITNGKLHEARGEITAFNNHLQEVVEEQTHQVKNSFEKLIRSEKAGASLRVINGISHTFNTPLGTAIMSLSIVKRELQLLKTENIEAEQNSGFRKNLDESLKLLDKSLDRMKKIISQLKVFSESSLHLERNFFDIQQSLKMMLFGIEDQNLRRKITVTCPSELKAEGTAAVFSRVMLILIDNTIMHGYTNDGDIAVSISVSEKDDAVLVEYADQGSGINESDMPYVFDPFYAGQGKKTMPGLGLAILHKLVTEELHGTVELPESDSGAKFRIFLRSVKRVDA